MTSRTLGIIGSIFGFASVLNGALASHWLKSKLTFDQLEGFKTSVYFLFFHALLFLLFSMVNLVDKKRSILLLLTGISLFCGSIFLLSYKHALQFELPHWFHFVTPLGGFILLAGWLLLILSWKEKESK